MKCYCIEKNDKFIYSVENVEAEYIKNMEIAGFTKEGDKYIKEYPNNIQDKEIIKNNFQRIGESLFKNEGNWEKSLEIFAERCSKANIDWIMVGSISEAVYGINIVPHDIDIVVYTEDFYKIKSLFLDYLIDPFDNNGGTWIFQYFGRLCIDGILIEIAADSRDENKEFYIFENRMWKKYELKIKPIKKRYEIEVQRNRIERIEKIKEEK
jgi:hypothetical protein